MIYKTYKHNPPHLFVKGAKYFITTATYKKKRFLKKSGVKERLLLSLQKEFYKHNWKIEDWVILDNHYHLMANAPQEAETLPSIIKKVHRFAALWIKKNFDLESINNVNGAPTWSVKPKSEKIFYNYWDTCITFEKSYFARLNYIWYNPVKHGYVKSPDQWEFGSYFLRYKEDSKYIQKLHDKYPFDKLNINDNF